jgi:hypothetical protein
MLEEYFQVEDDGFSWLTDVEHCFGDRVLTGVNIKTLKPKSEDSNLLCKWLEEGVFDALSKKYVPNYTFMV